MGLDELRLIYTGATNSNKKGSKKKIHHGG